MLCTLAGHYKGCRQLTWRLIQQPLTLVVIAPTHIYPAASLVCGCSLHWGNTEPMCRPLYRANTPEQTHNTECNYNHSINSKTSFETIPYSAYNNNLILYSSSIPHYANKCNRSCVRNSMLCTYIHTIMDAVRGRNTLNSYTSVDCDAQLWSTGLVESMACPFAMQNPLVNLLGDMISPHLLMIA